MIDTILARHKLVWKLNPYRIEDVNGLIIQAGPHFDVRAEAVKYSIQRAIRRNNNQFRYPSTSDINKMDNIDANCRLNPV